MVESCDLISTMSSLLRSSLKAQNDYEGENFKENQTPQNSENSSQNSLGSQKTGLYSDRKGGLSEYFKAVGDVQMEVINIIGKILEILYDEEKDSLLDKFDQDIADDLITVFLHDMEQRVLVSLSKNKILIRK